MIKELFLTVALSLPAHFSGHHPAMPNRDDASVLRMLASFYLREAHHDLPNSSVSEYPSSRMVVLADHGDIVGSLRRVGIQAWQMSPFAGMSDWSIQGRLRQSPIREQSVHIVWGIEAIRDFVDLFALMRMVRTLGFLIIDMPRDGRLWLKEFGFQRIPFDWRDYEIWRRSA